MLISPRMHLSLMILLITTAPIVSQWHKDNGNIIATGVRDSGLYRLDLVVKAPSTCRICESSDLVQPSAVPPLNPPVTNPADDLPHEQPADAQLGLQSDTVPRAPPAAPRAPPVAMHPMQTRAKSGICKPRYPATINCASLLTALKAISEPRGITTALKSPEWVRAMLGELSALKANNTWSLVSRPSSTNIVNSR
ncbi:Uncharacterized mitochondrial protein AtMg00820 [Striga hermonthica]|uniref:Uncharacterized mitochondrial protein AtMg00820 n=1 Tax=Striga hermonthica TaxID=68872 RepID=A0A9N7MYQ6_STRHE|nr:Uncharacterized mitochondrial protein AtMg00820 [Striga hermonthica]